MFISFIIPTKNEESYIASSISAILNQDHFKGQFEIVISDGGSTDSTLEIIDRFNLAPAKNASDYEKERLSLGRSAWSVVRKEEHDSFQHG